MLLWNDLVGRADQVGKDTVQVGYQDSRVSLLDTCHEQCTKGEMKRGVHRDGGLCEKSPVNRADAADRVKIPIRNSSMHGHGIPVAKSRTAVGKRQLVNEN